LVISPQVLCEVRVQSVQLLFDRLRLPKKTPHAVKQ